MSSARHLLADAARRLLWHTPYVLAWPGLERRHEWSIGVLTGSDPTTLGPPPGVVNPVLTRRDVTDVRADFVADPFLLRSPIGWHMFFELWNISTSRGEIGLASSADGRDWSYQGVVLAEPFHLSYPHVFEAEGERWMLPETFEAGEVRLYRAAAYPSRWEHAATLLKGDVLLDPTLVRHDGLWYLFADTSPDRGNHTLSLFCSADLLHGWEEHPASPVVRGDPRSARPAGRIVPRGDHLLRFAQDCVPEYGSAVRAFEITTLTPERYEERAGDDRPILAASGRGWNASGMHQVDAHRLDDGTWYACADGRAWLDRRR